MCFVFNDLPFFLLFGHLYAFTSAISAAEIHSKRKQQFLHNQMSEDLS